MNGNPDIHIIHNLKSRLDCCSIRSHRSSLLKRLFASPPSPFLFRISPVCVSIIITLHFSIDPAHLASFIGILIFHHPQIPPHPDPLRKRGKIPSMLATLLHSNNSRHEVPIRGPVRSGPGTSNHSITTTITTTIITTKIHISSIFAPIVIQRFASPVPIINTVLHTPQVESYILSSF